MKGATYLVVAAFLAGICGFARAGDVVEPAGMELYPTYYAVGIEIPYIGDDDGDAAAEFVWRRAGESGWHNGVDMTIDRAKGFIWASVWPLDEGTTIEVKVSITDPDAGGGITREAAVTTRKMLLEPSGDGRKFYVSPAGGDASEGTADAPFRTLRYAATVAGPGDAIYALSGVYREGNLFERLAGERERPIIIAAAEGHEPVLDGSVAIPAESGVWRAHEGGIYVSDFRSPTGYVGYVAQDGLRAFKFRSLADMQREALATDWQEAFTVDRGWYFDADADKLYVRNLDGSSPEEHLYNVAVLEQAVNFSDARHVVLRGFEIRNYGYAGVRVGEGAQSCVIYGNTIHNIPAGVFVTGLETDDTAVWHNDIREPGLPEYSWSQNKGSRFLRQGVTGWLRGRRGTLGRGTSVCHNRISGFFDGIMPGCWNTTEQLRVCRDYDIMYNHISEIGDDAIEIDGAGVNQRIHGNTIRNAFAAISMAGVEKGPVYCTRNDATFYTIMYKLNVGGPESLGWAYVYHNSGYCLSHGDVYGGTAVSFPPVTTMPIDNKVFKNNATICDSLGIRYGNDRYDLDFNCYWNVPGQEPVNFRWEKPAGDAWEVIYYTSIEDLRRETGLELHGMVADPQFRHTPALGVFLRGDYGPVPFSDYLASGDSSDADLSLGEGSPCIDTGLLIRGINEDFEGAAPDIGAFETKK